jgi:transcription elongation factor GreA
MNDTNIITAEGLEKLKQELENIKAKLKEVAVRIKDAKDLGDLSENAEYHEAKNEQSFLYGKELTIEEKIRNAQVIGGKYCSETVEAGGTVEVENEGDKLKYKIVGSTESDPMNGLISISSPIGSALSGHKKGDVITVNTPAGKTEYKILKIA